MTPLMNGLLVLRQKIESASLVTPGTFRMDIDEALDQRNQPAFDAEWSNAKLPAARRP